MLPTPLAGQNTQHSPNASKSFGMRAKIRFLRDDEFPVKESQKINFPKSDVEAILPLVESPVRALPKKFEF